MNMNKCIKCGKFPFCKEAEENKKECDKFIKRKGGHDDVWYLGKCDRSGNAGHRCGPGCPFSVEIPQVRRTL